MHATMAINGASYVRASTLGGCRSIASYDECVCTPDCDRMLAIQARSLRCARTNLYFRSEGLQTVTCAMGHNRCYELSSQKICCHLHNLHKSCHVHNRPEQISAQERNFHGRAVGKWASSHESNEPDEQSFLFVSLFSAHDKEYKGSVQCHGLTCIHLRFLYTPQFHPCQSGTVANISTG
jgi:hypothetical protein